MDEWMDGWGELKEHEFDFRGFDFEGFEYFFTEP